MNTTDLLALYDRDERRNVDEPGMLRQVDGEVVQFVDRVGTDSMVIYSRLDAATADRAIDRQIGYFAKIGHNLEWKLYAHDQPADLHQRLLAHGFTDDQPEAVMALDLTEIPPDLRQPPTAQIRRCEDSDRLKDAMRAYRTVWPEKADRLYDRLAYLLANDPQRLSIYVAYVDARPVASSRVHFSPRSAFSSLCGGATRPAYRGQGLYTQMLAVRLQEASALGVRFVTVDAGAISRPITERHGFRPLTFTQAHVRRRDRGTRSSGGLAATQPLNA